MEEITHNAQTRHQEKDLSAEFVKEDTFMLIRRVKEINSVNLVFFIERCCHKTGDLTVGNKPG